MNSHLKLKFRQRKQPATILGLVLDSGKLDGVVLRRTNGTLQPLQSFTAPLTLDLLTAAPELAGGIRVGSTQVTPRRRQLSRMSCRRSSATSCATNRP